MLVELFTNYYLLGMVQGFSFCATGVAATFFCEPMVSFVCIFFNIWIWFRLFLNTFCIFRDHRVLNNLSVLLNIGCSSASQYWLLGNSAMAYILGSHVPKLILLASFNMYSLDFCVLTFTPGPVIILSLCHSGNVYIIYLCWG